ncbi:MAG: hypothetical protein ACRDLS_07690 [Solirubrobacteraceae bacterium]
MREGIEVTSLRPGPDGGFRLETSSGEIAAGTVVLSTGAFQRPTERRQRRRCRPSCCRSTSRTTATRGIPRPARCWWSGAASPAARSPRSCTRPAATCSWPAGGLRGSPAGWAIGTSVGGRSRRASSTRRCARCRARPLAWRPTCRRRGPAAATTSTTARCGRWASPWSVTFWAPTATTLASRRTSARASPGATSAGRSSWMGSASSSPSAACRGRRSPSRSRSTRRRPRS